MDLNRNELLNFKSLMIYASVLILLGIGLGAFGAHGLENIQELTPQNIASWKTGVLYQLLMGLGILVIVVLSFLLELPKSKLPAQIIAIGVSLFSFSIYILVLNHIWNIDTIKYAMVALTPLGGLTMMAGWLLFILELIKKS